MKITQSGRAAQEGEPGGLADKTTAPEEFALPDEFSPLPEEFPEPAEEAAKLPPEFGAPGQDVPAKDGRRKRIKIYAAAALCFVLLLGILPSPAHVQEPEPSSPVTLQESATGQEPEDTVPAVTQDTIPQNTNTVTEPSTQDTTVATEETEPDMPDVEAYSAFFASSYLVDLAFHNPEDIESASLVLQNESQELLDLPDGEDSVIPRADIDAGFYRATYTMPPEGMRFCVHEVKQDGTQAVIPVQYMGMMADIFGAQYADGSVAITLWLGRNPPPVVFGGPELADGQNVAVSILADGQPVPVEECSSALQEIPQEDPADQPLTNTLCTADLPEPPQESLSVVVYQALNGHLFTYSQDLSYLLP